MKWLLGIIALAALAAFYVNVGDDYDVWWHLRYGEYFIANRTWRPDHTLYSWTPVNADWRYVTWLGDVILYAVYRIGGFALLNCLQWGLFLGVAGLVGRAARTAGGKFNLMHLAALLGVGIAINPVAAYIKPELFTVFFFTLTVFIYFESKRTGRDWFFWYPPLFLVWVNTHGGFINGLLFLGIVWMSEGVAMRLRAAAALPRCLWWRLTAALALSGVALLVNPHGIWYPLDIAVTLLEGIGGSHVQAVTAYTSLWHYLLPGRMVFRLFDMAWTMMFMGLIAFWCMVWLRLKKDFFDPALAAALSLFFIFAFSMARAGIYFALLWPFALIRMEQKGGWGSSRRVQTAAAVVVVLLSGLILYQTATINTYDSWFGSRVENWSPVNEASAIREYEMPPPLFNDYLSGGYLIWALYPEYRVFIDPRYGPYEDTGIWDEYVALRYMQNLTAGWNRLAEKYRFNTVILHVEHNFRLIDTILDLPAWRLVYFDRVAVVFVRTELAQSQDIWEAGRRAMSPEKFAGVTNPGILFRAFYLYCNYEPAAAARILEIYRRNVRWWYRNRAYHIRRMEIILAPGK